MAIKLKNTDLKIVKGNTLIKSMMLGDKTIYGVAIQGPYIFSIQNNGATLTGITEIGKQLSVINIPPSYNGLTVKRIDNKAFDGCNNLTSIKIPNSVTSIGTWAFRNCIGLTSITIPNSVEFIDWGIIEGCDALTSINVEPSNAKYHSAGNCIIETATKTLILGCNNSVIPAGGSVTSIRWNAFQNCTGLTSMTIPNTVMSIGDSVFDGCTGLTSITIPNSVTSIGMRAFYGCFGLTTATIGSGVRSIGQEAFSTCTRLTSITIPNSVTSIGSYAFEDCSGLNTVTIGSGVTSIGYGAFANCVGLTSITLPFVGNALNNTSNTHFGYIFGASDYSFNASKVPTSLKTVVITGGTSIGRFAFYGCSGLTSITIPNSVTSIEAKAFQDCSGLTSITLPFVGETLNGTANTHFGYIFGAVRSHVDNPTFVPTSLKTVVITGGTSIGRFAFYGCSGLTKVTIPASVTNIEAGAFSTCTGLTSTIIPDSVTSIGEVAFIQCNGLISATIGNSVTITGHSIFNGCTGMKSINCKAPSQPSGWDSLWKGDCTATVVWGYKGA